MTYRGGLPPGQSWPGQPPPGAHPDVNYAAYLNGNAPNAPYQIPAPAYPQQSIPYYANNPVAAAGYSGGIDPSMTILPRPPPSREPHLAPPALLPNSGYQPPLPPQRVVSSSQAPLHLPGHGVPLVAEYQPQPQLAHVSQPSRPSIAGGVGVEARRVSSSPIVKSKSPVVPKSPAPQIDTVAVLACVAEDCFAKAADVVRLVARSSDQNVLRDYHKLVATGLGCLEAAIHSSKLGARAEARIRLRYAAVLLEETENLMEAETALTKGIATCEKHRLLDLKYCMQFLLIKVLFRRKKPKAALIAIDGTIADCKTYKHIHWVYAFHFLKASFYLQSGNPADNHALENLRATAEIASRRGDNAICVMTSVLEGLTHLTAMKDDAIVRIQTCIAQVSKYQLDEAAHSPQIDILVSLLDLSCSLVQKSPTATAQKVAVLQQKMDAHRGEDWDSSATDLLLPIKKPSIMSQTTISNDTTAIIRPGNDACDFLVLNILSKSQGFALGYTFCGLSALFRPSSTPGKSSMYWHEALSLLDQAKQARKRPAVSLGQAIDQERWESDFRSYIYVLLGLQAATLSDWKQVKDCVASATARDGPLPSGVLGALVLYLKGVYYQGTGDVQRALQVWQDRRFSLDSVRNSLRSVQQTDSVLSLLAALNQLWVLQQPQCQDPDTITKLVDILQPLCEEHTDPELRTAYNLVMATIEGQKPVSINISKRHIQQALVHAQMTNSAHCLSIALTLLRWKLFDKVVGEQALKSAKASSAQAKKAGNLLWMSVAEGLLAESYEMAGLTKDAQATRELGTQRANEVFAKTQS